MVEIKSILFVDDEVNVLKSLKRLFMDCNYKIYMAESAKEALEILNNNVIDLVISDYKMPHINGVQFLKEVKEKYPKTIRMILSGFADISSIVESINEGNVYKFLAKPWNDQELITTIMRAFEHFQLQIINDSLVENLQKTNNELSELTLSLEKTISERTSELKIKNNALKISQHILNYLPLGVFGVDTTGMIVYINKTAQNYLTRHDIILSESIIGNESNIGKIINKKLHLESHIYEEILPDDNMKIIITPLLNEGGIIVVINFNTSEDSYNLNHEPQCEIKNG